LSKTSFRPLKDENVSNLETNKIIASAFNFVPGQILEFEVDEASEKIYKWEVKSDIYNNTYIECLSTGSKAWYKNVGDVFYFIAFEGGQTTLLYYFYLSSYKIISAFYKDLILDDEFPLTVYPAKGIKLLQDVCAPFYKFLNADYSLHYISEYEEENVKKISLKSTAQFGVFGKVRSSYNFNLILSDKGIEEFSVNHKDMQIIAKRKCK